MLTTSSYRVNIFGFAESDALAAADSLNLGLLDQRLGLEWIKDNIQLFGGNPNNITVFGQSAGAFSIGVQLLAYGGSNLKPLPFQRMITESGASSSIVGIETNSSAGHTSEVAALVNCRSSNSQQQLSCLRDVPLETLNNVTSAYKIKVDPLSGIGVFQPKSHTSFLPDRPSKLLRDGRFPNNVDILTGWNEDDGTLFEPAKIKSDADVIAALRSETFLDNQMTDESFAEMLTLYPVSDFSNYPAENISAQFFRTARISRDIQFTCPSIFMVDAMANHSEPNVRTYLYDLNATLDTADEAEANELYLGVTHGSDLPFVFDETAFLPKVPTNLVQLGNQISGSWAYFAHTGTLLAQTNRTLQDWPQARKDGYQGYQDGTLSVRVLGGHLEGPAVISAKGARGALAAENIVQRCAFWNSEKIQEQLGV